MKYKHENGGVDVQEMKPNERVAYTNMRRRQEDQSKMLAYLLKRSRVAQWAANAAIVAEQNSQQNQNQLPLQPPAPESNYGSMAKM